ncbi:MAG: hypothetical protein AVDCRST_MAG13-3390, partial [uncultured Solirubrobacteraceae bacterium]
RRLGTRLGRRRPRRGHRGRPRPARPGGAPGAHAHPRGDAPRAL